MKTLKQYSQDMKDNIHSPGYLAELAEEMSADYATLSEEMEEVQLKKPLIWTKIKKEKDGVEREKYLSDTLTEHCWRMQDLGQKEISLKYKLKGLEKMMKAINTATYIKNVESFSQY
jgi:hypothetical protein